jgi:hypothetical protein
MQIDLSENLLISPTCDLCLTGLGLHGQPCDSCGHSLNDETKPADEHMRLLMSWAAVLRQIDNTEAGATQW